MFKDNNIQDFDNFFKESFGNFQPESPAGVFEAVQSQLGAAATTGGAAGTGAAVKAGLALGKIITGAVAVVAVATTVYFAANNSSEKTLANNPATVTAERGVNETTQPANNQKLPDTSATPDAGNTGTGNPGINAGNSHNNTGANAANTAGISTSGQPLQNNTDGITVTGPADEQPLQNNTPKPAFEKQKTTVALYVSAAQVCPNEAVTFTIADDLTKFTYRINFGDGTSQLTKPGKAITHTYKNGGVYKINATETGGTKATQEQTVSIAVVKASFTAENVDKSIFRFVNNSSGAVRYNWYFGDDSEMSNAVSPVHAYTNLETKEYRVRLLAINEIGCVDSFTLGVKQTYTLTDEKPIIPNVFTPNGDGINERFEIGIRNEEKYSLVIVDRTGNKVFESTNKDITWDGTNIYTGEECPAATYRMVFVYKIKGFAEEKVQAAVTIRR